MPLVSDMVNRYVFFFGTSKQDRHKLEPPVPVMADTPVESSQRPAGNVGERTSRPVDRNGGCAGLPIGQSEFESWLHLLIAI